MTVMDVSLTASTVPRCSTMVWKVPSAFFTTLSLCCNCGRWDLSGLPGFPGLADLSGLPGLSCFFSCPGADWPGADWPGADCDRDGEGNGESADHAMAAPVPLKARATAPAMKAFRIRG
ncbi:hypothetical protein G205_22575 [Arthrobacter nitrophenolicus]|uniref:Uncharacterized protein n=1 Tax=Arthrobacter nitrophenolicus TaxID=683150 RepID=L8TN66_9MICC|nr:hypothetical protein G205_22575 [Arthrobacter nitrophenolicus]